MSRIDSFEDLECWQACRELRKFVKSSIVPTLPADERFRLADQIIRASRSTTANIAEGHGRRHYLDNAKFIRNSLGSLNETLDHTITAHDEHLVSDAMLSDFRCLFDKALNLTRGYAAYLQRQAKSQ